MSDGLEGTRRVMFCTAVEDHRPEMYPARSYSKVEALADNVEEIGGELDKLLCLDAAWVQ